MTHRLRGIGAPGAASVRTPRVNIEDLGDIAVGLPTIDSQRRIADFLDDQVARIDNIIDARRGQSNLFASRCLMCSLMWLESSALFPTHRSRGLAWRQDWTVQRLAWVVRCLDGKRVPLNAMERSDRQGAYPYYGASAIVD